MSWYWSAGILARRGKAYQRISGDSAAKNTARASRIRLALRRISAALPVRWRVGVTGGLGTVVSSGFGEVLPAGAPMAVMVRTSASATARPVAAAIRARMRGLPTAKLIHRQVGHRSNGRAR